MVEEAQEQTAEEETQKLPDSVWDEYHGQIVCLQLKMPYYAVTSPGVFARDQEGGLGAMPALRGLVHVKKDQRGEIRLTVEMSDPAEGVETRVRADVDPEEVAYVSITEKEPLVKPAT